VIASRGGKKTTVAIGGDRFIIHGYTTFLNRTFRGMKVEGLLMNSRVVNGIFDDLNPSTKSFLYFLSKPF
jgi:hypothetical protein